MNDQAVNVVAKIQKYSLGHDRGKNTDYITAYTCPLVILILTLEILCTEPQPQRRKQQQQQYNCHQFQSPFYSDILLNNLKFYQ